MFWGFWSKKHLLICKRNCQYISFPQSNIVRLLLPVVNPRTWINPPKYFLWDQDPFLSKSHWMMLRKKEKKKDETVKKKKLSSIIKEKKLFCLFVNLQNISKFANKINIFPYNYFWNHIQLVSLKWQSPGKKNKYLFGRLEISPHLYFYLRDVLDFFEKLQVAIFSFFFF